MLRQSTSRPRNLTVIGTPWALDLHMGFVIQIVPRASRGSGPSVLGLLRWLIVEVGIDHTVYRAPRHARRPEVLQAVPNTVFEVAARIEHERMPYHKHVCRRILGTVSTGRVRGTYLEVASWLESISVLCLHQSIS